MSTLNQKIAISIKSALIFALCNSPRIYNLSNEFIKQDLYNKAIKCPTNIGLVVHALLFFIITFLSMGNIFRNCKLPKNTGVKIKHSLYGTLIFYFLSSPAVYSLTNSFIGNKYSSKNGCPTIEGIMVHSLIYCVFLVLVMYLPERNK